MLSKELMGNILAVAAVSGNWSISIQNLEILALKHLLLRFRFAPVGHHGVQSKARSVSNVLGE